MKKISIVKFVPPKEKSLQKKVHVKKKYYRVLISLFKLYKCNVSQNKNKKNSHHFFDTHEDMISKWMKYMYNV